MRKKILKIMMSIMKFSPFFVKKKEFFENIKNTEKQAIAFWHPMCEWCEKIIFDFPILMFKSIKNWYKLNFCNYQFFPEQAKKLWIKTTPSLYLKTWDKIEIFEWDKEIKQKIRNF